jgi:hypothetical protein
MNDWTVRIDRYLPFTASFRADTWGMDIEVNVMPMCYKCDRKAIAYGDGHRALCARHAAIFVTTPRILQHERALEHDQRETVARRIEYGPATERPDPVAVVAARVLARLETLDALIEGMSPVNGTGGQVDSIGSPTAPTEIVYESGGGVGRCGVE